MKKETLPFMSSCYCSYYRWYDEFNVYRQRKYSPHSRSIKAFASTHVWVWAYFQNLIDREFVLWSIDGFHRMIIMKKTRLKDDLSPIRTKPRRIKHSDVILTWLMRLFLPKNLVHHAFMTKPDKKRFQQQRQRRQIWKKCEISVKKKNKRRKNICSLSPRTKIKESTNLQQIRKEC